MQDKHTDFLMKVFTFLEEENKIKTTCGIFIISKNERFDRPFLIIDFATLFDVPDDIPVFLKDIVLDDDEFALGKLRAAALEPDLFEEKWCFGVIHLSNKLFGDIQTVFKVLEWKNCQENIFSLIKQRDFYVGDITKKLNEENERQFGFGLFAEDGYTFYGFAFYKIEEINLKLHSLQLHIEYICTNCMAPRGTGCQLTVKCIKYAQHYYPGYDINVFIEAKPTAKAIGFWLIKMGFQVDKGSWIDGAYYPSYKMYGGNSILHF
mmetsp:Transcript_11152/g.15374  ORF Transcript_11152/g.15374 Transcript_11152/m.15374 type:complete len:264 (-) Transcript_11152:153-944(-)